MPFGDAGIEKVREYWLAMQRRMDGADQSSSDEDLQSEIDVEAQTEMAEPITIQYLTELALASS